ncbi:hypothetical protein ACSTH7_25070, partial [Vibrio parahaemolyticus]
VGTIVAPAFTAAAQDSLLQAERKALQGKTIAYVPVILAAPLATVWGKVMEREAADYGMKIVTRDPNWNA